MRNSDTQYALFVDNKIKILLLKKRVKKEKSMLLSDDNLKHIR